LSRIQDRIGPNRLGPYGLFQTVADAMKLLSKEDIKPRRRTRLAYLHCACVVGRSGVDGAGGHPVWRRADRR
jgi:NADH:ubiquinone oxidoreductase subunit H